MGRRKNRLRRTPAASSSSGGERDGGFHSLDVDEVSHYGVPEGVPPVLPAASLLRLGGAPRHPPEGELEVSVVDLGQVEVGQKLELGLEERQDLGHGDGLGERS